MKKILTTRQLILDRLHRSHFQVMTQTRLHEALRCREDGRKVLRKLLADGNITKYKHAEPGARGRRPLVYKLIRRD